MSIEEDIQSKTNVALSGAHTSTKARQSPLIQSILIQYQIDPSINPWKIKKKNGVYSHPGPILHQFHKNPLSVCLV